MAAARRSRKGHRRLLVNRIQTTRWSYSINGLRRRLGRIDEDRSPRNPRALRKNAGNSAKSTNRPVRTRFNSRRRSGRVRESRRAQVGGHLRAWRARQRQFAVLLVLPCDRVGIAATRRVLCRKIIGRAKVRMRVGDRNVPCAHARPAATDRRVDQRRHRAREVVRTIDARTVAACAYRSGPRGEIGARVVTGGPAVLPVDRGKRS